MSALKDRIAIDFKAAMLARDTELADVLRGLKSAILYEEVALKKRETGLNEAEIEHVIAREAKKRDEAAGLYDQGGNAESAAKERREKAMLSKYLPQQISNEELMQIITTIIAEAGETPHMGKIIGAVKQKVGNRAEGARVAGAVQQALKNAVS